MVRLAQAGRAFAGGLPAGVRLLEGASGAATAAQAAAAWLGAALSVASQTGPAVGGFVPASTCALFGVVAICACCVGCLLGLGWGLLLGSWAPQAARALLGAAYRALVGGPLRQAVDLKKLEGTALAAAYGVGRGGRRGE